MSFKPPICPYCSEPLDRVGENTYETYTFNPKTGRYKSDGEAYTFCLNCNAKIYEVFPDGACNYDAKESDEEPK